MKQTIQLVEQWAEEKGILSKATTIKQAMKTQEEVNELCNAILDDNREEIKDAIGDIMVTLIIQCKMQGMDLEDCLESAYNVIKNRTGKMENGVFVKRLVYLHKL
jgi:NTP pyrophosphatase (non-canonical NTP hydrolase)